MEALVLLVSILLLMPGQAASSSATEILTIAGVLLVAITYIYLRTPWRSLRVTPWMMLVAIARCACDLTEH